MKGHKLPDHLLPPKASQWSTGDAIGMWNAAQIRIAGTSRAKVDLRLKVRFMDPVISARAGSAFSIFFTIVAIKLLCSACPLVARGGGLSILLCILNAVSIHINCAATPLIYKQRFSNHNETYFILNTALRYVKSFDICLYLFLQMTLNA